ncbi:MAG: ABC transporter permease [Oscillospiraceae bacterium]|nr:ABC transporter permease [Oscillospiraceae bacterium]
MRISEILKMVLMNILANKSKGFLTSLGIAVGSATIVLVIAVGQGGRQDVAEQFKNLNAGAIEISVGQSADKMFEDMMGGGGPGGGMPGGNMPSFDGNMPAAPSGGNKPSKQGGGFPSGGSGFGGMGGGRSGGNALSGVNGVKLTVDDAEDIAAYVPDVEAVSIVLTGNSAVAGGELEEETEYTIAGVMADYQSISNLELLYGEFFNEYDEEDKEKVCVLGYTAAQEIFGAAYLAEGDTVTIEGKNYEVVGVLSQMGTVSSGISPDSSIYVPYSTAQKYIFSSSTAPTITAVASDADKVETVIENINTLLTETYPQTSFTLTDAGSAMKAANNSANTLQTLLIAAAVIVFIVGGIGIMNVLFVTVKERTKEIGILKALGSRRSVILLLFLLEASIIAVFGGAVGAAAGYALIPLVNKLGTTAVAVSYAGILGAGFAVFTGTVFGFYPAYKASHLKPVEALSQD